MSDANEQVQRMKASEEETGIVKNQPTKKKRHPIKRNRKKCPSRNCICY